jgi:hypothetical protein
LYKLNDLLTLNLFSMSLFKKHVYLFSFFSGLLIIFSNCTPRFPNYPTSKNCLFSVSEPKDFNCFKTRSGSTGKIKLKISIEVKYLVTNSLGMTSEKIWPNGTASVIADPVFPIYLNAEIPASGPSTVEVSIQGDECSACASNLSDPNETPYGPCVLTALNTVPISYRAAYPRWFGIRGIQDGNTTNALNFSQAPRIVNVPNSCGCTIQQ